MSEENESDNPESIGDSLGGGKRVKSRPVKNLPTDRLSFEKQLSVLRGYAAASGPDKKAVGNNEVSQIVGLHAGTISNCNPFFAESGLLIRDGQKYRPSEEVVAYASSYQWDQEKAVAKLAPVLETTWFAQTLKPKLSFRSFSREEAVAFLAEEAKASPEYKVQLEMLLDYLSFAGVIAAEGNMIAVVPGRRLVGHLAGGEILHGHSGGHGAGEHGAAQSPPPPPPPPQPNKNTEEFSIPIPGKESAKIIIPKGLEAEDWDMLKDMLDAYISRLRKKSMAVTGLEGEDQ